MNSVLMIFMDGVGIGKEDYEYNPFFKYKFRSMLETFGTIPHLDNQQFHKDDKFFFPIDARMGIPDLPLSGTGQTSIFCGVNASEIIGMHFGPYPYSTLVPIIKEKNIFKEFLRRRKKVFFANSYPKVFFEYVDSGRRRLSVTTLSCILSGVRLNRINDLHKGNALSADIDNERLITRMNYKLPLIKAETAANRLLRIASKNHFTLFEIFHTDHLGHGRIKERLDSFTEVLDRFLLQLLKNHAEEITLIICSDHGNYEDLSIKSHTLNPVLGITSGKKAGYLAEKIKYLYDIKPAIMDLYD